VEDAIVTILLVYTDKEATSGRRYGMRTRSKKSNGIDKEEAALLVMMIKIQTLT
jgi:hypothetical protein